jgi:hypothetical protein
MTLQDITDALVAAQKRGLLPTSLSTEELRELGAGILARNVFAARAVSAVYVAKLKEVVDAMAGGALSEGQVRTALYETLDALGYTPEGGFPDRDAAAGDAAGAVPPALQGTLQDLRSYRRTDLIVRTQRDLTQGAGTQMRGHTPDRLAVFPAWELVRIGSVAVPRDWPSRWTIAGGRLLDGRRMVAFKGDPVWGELGAYDNFQDALGVDHPPFAFNSGMGWAEISAAECRALGVTGPAGESAEEFHAGEQRPRVMAGKLPLPTPKVSLEGVDPEIIAEFKAATQATAAPGKPKVFDYSALLEKQLKAADAAYQKGAPTR